LNNIETVEQNMTPMRKAYWWGAPFRWDELDSYRGPIVTIHADPTSLLQKLNRVAQVRFRWNFPKDEHIAVLQIEEFREAPDAATPGCTTKYLHSILNLDNKTFGHLDGAIKTYSPEDYAKAYDDPAVKSGVYEKLFRTDDDLILGDQAWMDVVASYFANDELVREYFGGA
jgi:hypothetical protein